MHSSSPIAEIHYFIDNSTVIDNQGPIIETHRDLHSSANVFKWVFWRSWFLYNNNSGVSIELPYPFDRTTDRFHMFSFTENDVRENSNFQLELSGYFAWCNISANNFTNNQARPDRGIMRIFGMEKALFMQRNRFLFNKGRYVLSWEAHSQSVKNRSFTAEIFYNYFMQNYFLGPEQNYVDYFPRSYALGMFGAQKLNVSYNNFQNELLDFELVTGLTVGLMTGNLTLDSANVTMNYWGKSKSAEIVQRIFDFDDWNSYSIANYNPYMMSEEFVHRWDWHYSLAQLDSYYPGDPSVDDLKGRLFSSVTLVRRREKWPEFPHYFKPDRPYVISKDLTIMPGATLTIEKGVEIHLYPNVRILVLGTLIAEGKEF